MATITTDKHLACNVVVTSTIAGDDNMPDKALIASLLVLVSVGVAVWATRRRSRGSGYTEDEVGQ
ncbi:MAG: hypothetical protein OEV56_00670 [Dehalococcoidia bacterium]|nr:hypothetical protein [Dehalococcoidia bacterium]